MASGQTVAVVGVTSISVDSSGKSGLILFAKASTVSAVSECIGVSSVGRLERDGRPEPWRGGRTARARGAVSFVADRSPDEGE